MARYREHYYRTIVKDKDGNLSFFVQKNWNMVNAWDHAHKVMQDYPQFEVDEISRISKEMGEEYSRRDEIFIAL
jgi:hypothetical protein